jgi:hypothetical protein
VTLTSQDQIFLEDVLVNGSEPLPAGRRRKVPGGDTSDADFAAIKLAPGIEAKSYLKDGVLFSEDAKGRIIELQILNLSLTAQPKPKKQRKVG